jgi:hypothetical protein
MSLLRPLFKLLLLAAIAAGIGQYLIYERADKDVRRVVRLSKPVGQIRYEFFWPWLWGGGTARMLSLEPSTALREHLDLAAGQRLQLERLDLREVALDSARLPTAFVADLHGLVLPLPPAATARPSSAPAPVQALRWLSLSEIGLEQITLDGTLRFARRDGQWRLSFNGAARELAGIELQFEGVPGDTFLQGNWTDLRLDGLQLILRDRGLLPRYKAAMAMARRESATALEQNLLEWLEARSQSEDWRWDAASADALRLYLRHGGDAQLTLEPPLQVDLRNLGLYRIGDRFTLLGFRFAPAPPPPPAP